MASSNGEFDLVVIAGADADRGVRVRIGRQPVVIGRGAGAGLALSDARVSREHAQAVASEEGIAFVVLPDARRPLLHRGERLERAVVGLGDEIRIGDTVLRVEESQSGERRIDARTLLTGEAEDVRAAAALYGLSDSLRTCFNRPAIERAVSEWARSAPVRAIEAHLVPDVRARPANKGSGGDDVVVRGEGSAGSVVVVSLQGSSNLYLHVRYALEPHRVADSLQRLLFVAGMIIASRLSAVHALSGVQQDRDFVRSVAFGQSRSFIGASVPAARLEERIERLSGADATVLLFGRPERGRRSSRVSSMSVVRERTPRSAR